MKCSTTNLIPPLQFNQRTYLTKVSSCKLGLCQRKCGLLHDLAHRLFRLHNLLEDQPEPELQRVGLLLQQTVAFLGTLETAFHSGHGT